MLLRVVFVIILSIIFGLSVFSQENRLEKKEVTGKVTDVNNLPLKGVFIFADSIKTRVKTNRTGFYKIKLHSTTKILTAYLPRLGILNMEYTGQSKVDFLFTQQAKPITEGKLIELGYILYPEPLVDTSWYKDYASVLELLDKRFYNVIVKNGKIKIGKGPNQFSGDNDPLILLNNQPIDVASLETIGTSDIKSIRVINRGSETAAYGGLKAANGVILITLKQYQD